MTPDDLSGTELDDYALDEPLGKGGMGVVYRGRDLALRRPVAIKVLSPHLLEDGPARQRFQQEISHAAAIEHPHVVPVYAAGYDKGVFYLVLRLIKGPDVAAELKANGPFSPERTMRVVGQVASALWTVHSQGLVHRDIKPHNVLLGALGQADEHAVLTDFGIAKALGASSSLTGVGPIGTPPYMAPELWRGISASPASDQYALACMAYEMITGAACFAGTDDIAEAHLNATPASLDAVAPHADRRLAEAVARALSKDPSERFPDVRAFVSLTQAGRRSFDDATTLTSVVAEAQTREFAARRLVAETELTDAAIALHTGVEAHNVTRLRRRAARAALVGGVGAKRTST